jgi:hypothetical protein
MFFFEDDVAYISLIMRKWLFFMVFLHFQALQCPNKFLEEAKMVLDGSSELANYPAIKEKKVGAVEDKESLQERRPALGRKRARFFLKPNLM